MRKPTAGFTSTFQCSLFRSGLASIMEQTYRSISLVRAIFHRTQTQCGCVRKFVLKNHCLTLLTALICVLLLTSQTIKGQQRSKCTSDRHCGAGDRNWSRNLGSNSARSGLILANVVKISTSGIIRYSEAYERRYAVHSSHRSLAPLQKQCRGDNK